MRNLRAIYNRAVERELTVQRYPFKHVYTGVDKTVKRAVPLKVIRRIRDLDLTLSPVLDYARDLFMFSFYTRGMAFVDMAYLKRRIAERSSGLSPPEDGTAAFYQVGETHAGDCRQVRYVRDSLSAADHPGYGYGCPKAIQERRPSCQ